MKWSWEGIYRGAALTHLVGGWTKTDVKGTLKAKAVHSISEDQ